MTNQASDVQQLSSGSKLIDAMREEVAESPTTPDNYRLRMLRLHMWMGALQHQGANIWPFYDINNDCITLHRQVGLAYERRGTLNEREQTSLSELCEKIHRGFSVLDEILRDYVENGPWFETGVDESAAPAPTAGRDIEWPTFQGNRHNTGATAGPGPTRGACAWKFPVALGWYASPVVEGDRIYCTSPGMDTTCFCLNLADGSEIWRSHQEHLQFGIYKYPCLASTPVLREDEIVVRELNSHGGDDGQAKHLVHIDKETGAVRARTYAGHVDYRARYAPVDGNEDVVVYPYGVQDIYSTPAVHQNFNRLICKDRNNEQLLWDFNAGDIDVLAQAVVTDTLVLQGTEDGYLYALCLPGHEQYKRHPSGVQAWSFHVGASINTSVAVYGDLVVFGANDGCVYALQLASGDVVWKQQVSVADPCARKQFSTPCVAGDQVFIGSADNKLHALALADGAALWSAETTDWIRSRPVVLNEQVMVADLSGTVFAFDLNGQTLWHQRVSKHPIYADLKLGADRVLVSDSDLSLICLAADGSEQWRHCILSSFIDANGDRIWTDQLAGGTYFQSKPVGYAGKVIFGTPSGFLFAVDPDTGEEQWKFEMGAAISVGATCADGRVFAGQQGGEPHFYCIDVETGKPLWRQAIPGGWVWGSAKVDDGKVYIPTVSGYAMCLDAETGHIIWMYQTAKSIPAEPAIWEDFVYFGSWSKSLYAFCKHTGKIIWKNNSGIGLDSGTLIVLDGKVYVPDHKNIFRCYDAATGQELSDGNKDDSQKLKFWNFNATPAIQGNRGYFSARVTPGLQGIPLTSRVYCVDLETADVQWDFPDGGGLSAPAIADDKVYIASGNSPYFHCLDAITGKSKWVYKLGHRVEESTLCIYHGKVYALAADGYVHAIE